MPGTAGAHAAMIRPMAKMGRSTEPRDVRRHPHPASAIGPRIRMMLPELGPSEARIAEVVLRSTVDEQFTIKRVATEAGASEAMVVKAAKKLGYEGFRELRAALAEYKAQATVDLHEEVTPEDRAETIVRKVFRTSIQALEETLSILDLEAFEWAADLIGKSRQRDFYGLGGSAQIARDVAHKFLRIGVRCSVFDDTHMMAMSASLLSDGDVVVAFSHSGRTSGILDAAEIAKKNGARVIALTNYDNSPLASLADVTLCSTAQGSPLTGENAAARIAQLNIMDAIFVAVAQKSYAVAERNLAKTMGAVKTKRI
jgi:RpiR family transcriptional regulator, repressor of rpiB and als operon